MFLTDCLQVKEFKEWTQEYKTSTCFQFHSNVLQVHPSSTSRTSEKLHEIFAGFADRTRAAGVRGLKACVGEVFLSRRRACGLSRPRAKQLWSLSPNDRSKTLNCLELCPKDLSAPIDSHRGTMWLMCQACFKRSFSFWSPWWSPNWNTCNSKFRFQFR